LATKTLENAKRVEAPDWRIPKIEVVVRKTGTYIDDEVEEEYKDDETTVGCDSDEDEREREEQESSWCQQAAARMIHSVSREQIKLWKRKYLPSRKVSLGDWFYEKRQLGSYYTDSETEQGSFPKPYEHTDTDTDTDDEW
jgi:hypothetical protein